MMRVVLSVMLLAASLGVGAHHIQGTLASLQDTGEAGASFTANMETNGTADPGHAYEDVNNDGLFTEGLDVAIEDTELLDGTYLVEDPDHGLVVPRSVGTLEPIAGDVHLESGERGHLIVDAKLGAPEAIYLSAGTHANLSQLVAEAGTEVRIHAGGGIRALGVTLGAGGDIELTAAGGPVHMRDALVESQGQVEVSGAADVRADGARIEANGTVVLRAGGDVYVKTASLETDGEIVLQAGSSDRTLFVEGARFEDANDTAQAAPDGVEIVGTPAKGAIDHAG